MDLNTEKDSSLKGKHMVTGKRKFKFAVWCTLAKTELLYPKNAGA